MFCFCLSGTYTISAQSISGGFKTGLNFSRFDGEQINDANGNSLESFDNSTGFHIGAIVNFNLTDYFGFRTELLYSQKGTSYIYDGPSYLRLYNENLSQNVVLDGNRRYSVNINNSYVDIPVMAYFRVGRIEVSAGVNAAVLLGSRASGELAFRDVKTPLGQNLDDIIISIDANYFQDEYQVQDFLDPGSLLIQNGAYVVPKTIGAYYDANDSDENLFNRLDLGLNAQLAFYLNKGLFLGLRMNYGLTDVTNESQDVDYQALNQSGQVELRDDFDQNISFQVSIGFSF